MKKFLATTALSVSLAFGAAGGANALSDVNWDMQSTYASTLTQLGSMGKVLTDRLSSMSGGKINIKFQEPGAIVPALEAFDAVASGAVQAAWSTPGYWTGKDTSLALFSAVPFGPAAGEYYSWIKFGGGKELFDEIYHGYGIHSVICGVIAPEASGWFRKEINSIDDMKGLKMRFFGLGAKVMQKIGVSTQLLAGGDIFPALELGTIDATEFSMPAIDLKLGFYQVAKHYYFPGWHQQSTLFELMINLDEWNGLDDEARSAIEAACEANVAYGLAEGEAIQFGALKELQAKGVTIHTWPQEILDTLNGKWLEVVEEEKAANPNFAKVWASLSAFRADYKLWKDLGYLK
ncbi:MAG: TRAP transporter substrate-binding protein [Rhodobiaceae bacterium]|nr:TRAP transporter substrate-binding protein [Rhodobiaceae bacterium]MCC0015836.1 TRAP transporter substrate-binding protein [Rhodobiaceae bacterium]MCC0040621.1 TRAP transporter substrate-binding protein [Rhodobiaceae bacterium]MCC0054094.1 TRAP transporter substrate-binding protein [Rhodobiaceae bacterium]